MNTINNRDAKIHYWTMGDSNNPPLLFSNGGPGDDHSYLISVAEHYADEFYCILYDQRACGQSTITDYDADTLHVKRFIDDIDALRQHFAYEKIALWGHSWGATLSLLYAIHYPEHVQSLVLVGMGPLTEEGYEIAGANLLRPLSEDQKLHLHQLRLQRKQAFASEDWDEHENIHIEMVTTYSIKAWFYSQEIARRFAKDFEAHYNYNPRISSFVMPTVKAMDILPLLDGKSFPVQIVYGYQDFEPITQAYQIKEYLPSTEIFFINETGHVPWYEKTDQFYDGTRAFLERSYYLKTLAEDDSEASAETEASGDD